MSAQVQPVFDEIVHAPNRLQICAMLDIEHELESEVSGLDRDIERLRVEADLERIGVVLTDKRFGQAA